MKLLNIINEILNEDNRIMLKPKNMNDPKVWFKSLLNSLDQKVYDRYPNSIFYVKDNEVYMEYDKENGYLWISYDKIWSVFQLKYHMEDLQIQRFIKDMMEEHYKLRGLTPYTGFTVYDVEVEEHYKLRGLTPGRTL